jgi:hypothetical protein
MAIADSIALPPERQSLAPFTKGTLEPELAVIKSS